MKIGLSNRTGNVLFGSKPQGRLSVVMCCLVILTITYSNYYNKFWKDPGRIIAHDVISYYQYLPAIFIYKDISMKFLKDDTGYFERKIWATPTETGWYMGRMTMGLAVMYSPFFLAAHALAEPLGHEPSGYSPPYKAGLIIASLAYLALGLFLLRKFLRFYFPDIAVALTLLLVGLATNLYFYTVMEPTMSHVFSFCLYALFLLLLHNWLIKPGWKGAIFLGLTAGLITLVRPSNIIIVLLILLWMVGSFADLRERASFLVKRWDKLAVMAIFAFLVVFPQLLYWKLASGHWLEYTYNQEGFFFDNPQFARGLFSYRKGWLIYTPVMLFAVAGLLLLAFKNRKLFWPVLVFSVVNMYIVFSWWSWWYGGGFGQRALIESYAVLSIPLAAFLNWTMTGRWYVKLVILALSAWFIFLNIFQTRQYYYGAIHWEAMTREAYWDSFLHYHPSDRFQYLIRYPDVEIAVQGIYVDRPPKKKPQPMVEGMTYQEFIVDMEAKIRADSAWMDKIREKSERWGQPVDSVIRKDAIWIWEQKTENNE